LVQSLQFLLQLELDSKICILSQSRRLPPLLVASNSKIISVGVICDEINSEY